MATGKSSMQITALVLRVALGGFFLYFGAEKLFRLDEFTRKVANYKIVIAPWDAVVAYMVPCFEIVVGLCLISGLLLRGALLTAAAMTFVFMIGIGQAMARGLDINCGCFSASDQPSNLGLHMALLVGMMAVIGFLAVADKFSARRGFSGKRLQLPGA
jgi:uncharacterized membrane protein YphA (DoxX/SURF4 family)